MKKNKPTSKNNRAKKQVPPSKVKLSEEWLDAQDLKQIFKVVDNTLANWRKWGIIQGSRIGRGYYYNKARIQDLLASKLGKGLTAVLILLNPDVALPELMM